MNTPGSASEKAGGLDLPGNLAEVPGCRGADRAFRVKVGDEFFLYYDL